MIPRSIVVGIANVDRRRDLAHPTTIEADLKACPTTGGSQKFIEFIEKELQPFVEKQYRVSNMRTLIGQSLGGLFSVEILLKKPGLFDKYIIVSPSLWWDNGSILNTAIAPHQKDIAVFLALGKEGKEMIKGAKRLASILKKDDSIKVHYQYFPKLDHANILHLAVYRAFEVLR
jgi:predicted alpha/beta superfamily hydrolase